MNRENKEEIEKEIEQTQKQIKMLEEMLNSSKQQLISLQSKLNSKNIEKWVEININDYEKEIELLIQYENLDEEMKNQLITFINDFKQKNHLE